MIPGTILTVNGTEWLVSREVASAFAESERLRGVYFQMAENNGRMARESLDELTRLRAQLRIAREGLEKLHKLGIAADMMSGVDPRDCVELSASTLAAIDAEGKR